LFTDFGVTGALGILDWYTLSVALFTLVALAAHGATHLAAATDGRVAERSAALAERLWPAALVLLALVTWQTGLVRAGFFHALFAHPAGWLAALAALGGLGAVVFGLIVGMEDLARTGSTLFIGGLVAGAAAGSYPELLHATTDPARSLTAFNAGTDAHGLEAGLWWFIPALGLSLGYAWLMARRYPRRVGADDD
jgi:cytochrome d ubiquinol oxidase subunit II